MANFKWLPSSSPFNMCYMLFTLYYHYIDMIYMLCILFTCCLHDIFNLHMKGSGFWQKTRKIWRKIQRNLVKTHLSLSWILANYLFITKGKFTYSLYCIGAIWYLLWFKCFSVKCCLQKHSLCKLFDILDVCTALHCTVNGYTLHITH